MTALAALIATACGPERAALVELSPGTPGDALCVWAYGDGERVFDQTYSRPDGSDLPPAGSLTFVAGARVSEEVVIGARVLRGGAVVAESRERIVFGDGLSQVDLPVRRCREQPPPSAPRTAGRFEPAPDHVEAADLDGDGRDELVTWVGGSLHVLDADAPDAVSRAVVDGPMGLRVAAFSDFDGDCELEVITTGADQVRLVTSPAGAAELGEPVAAGARDARPGAPMGVASLVSAGATGLAVLPRGGDTPATVEGAFDAIGVGDVDGDGVDDVVASGPGGTRLFFGGADALEERPDALPARVAAATGPLSLTDLDGDGRSDLLVAEGASVRAAVNRGDGLLEERGGASPVTLGADVVLLRTGDVDGDCREEAIALGMDGSAAVLRLTERGLEPVEGDWPTALDAAVGDFDGDGAREGVWLTPEGEVLSWRP